MNPDPLVALLHSRKALVLLFDFAVSIVLYFGSKYASISAFEDIKFLIGALQVPVAMLIGAIASEDNAAMHATAITDAANTAAQATVGIAPATVSVVPVVENKPI